MSDPGPTAPADSEAVEERAAQDVTATTDSYGGPVSDEELADVYLPPGQDEVHDTGSGTSAETAGSPPPVEPPD